MAYIPFIDKYKRAPFPALRQSEKIWLEEELRKLESVLDNHGEFINVHYGSFSDSNDQFAAAVNTAYAITFDTTDHSRGIYIGSPRSRVVVTKSGVYNFQFSLQFDKNSSSASHVYVWPRINGVDVSNSATKVGIQGPTAEVVAAWNFVLELNISDYFELMWSTADTGCHISHEPASSPVPAIPSAILTVTQIL